MEEHTAARRRVFQLLLQREDEHKAPEERIASMNIRTVNHDNL